LCCVEFKSMGQSSNSGGNASCLPCCGKKTSSVIPQNTDLATQAGIKLSQDDREGLKKSMAAREEEILMKDGVQGE
jgi:hypothetical protein